MGVCGQIIPVSQTQNKHVKVYQECSGRQQSRAGSLPRWEGLWGDVGWWPGQWLRTWVLTKPTSPAVCELCDLGQVTDTPRNWFPYLKSGSESSCLWVGGRCEAAWCRHIGKSISEHESLILSPPPARFSVFINNGVVRETGEVQRTSALWLPLSAAAVALG